ncbi:ribonuclease H-like domain-containing protein [Tanacetum coccineum]
MAQNSPSAQPSPMASNSPQTVPTIIPDPPQNTNPNPVLVHPMVTHFRVRTNRPPQRLSLHESSVSPLPNSYTDAFHDPNWQNVMIDEYHAFIKNNTWTLVPRLADTNIVRCMWLFRHKYLADGTLNRYKALLVANVHQLDVKNAFLHGNLSETVYMSQPPRFQDPRHLDYVCFLHWSLYGLRQPPRAWFQRFASYITRVGFHHSRCDSSLFIYRQGTDTAYLLLYVDDILLTTLSEMLLQQIIASLHPDFSLTELGSLNYSLGIFVTRDSSGMFLSQRQYAAEILDRAHMAGCNSSRTPVDTQSKLGDDGDPVFDPTLYRSLAGSLQYLTFTRPNITFAVQQICLYMHDPREPHFSALKRILRYVRDADWAGCPTTQRSTSGYCVFLGNNLLSWSSKRQPKLSRSSADVEYRGVANAIVETCWLQNLLRELHTPLSSATLVHYDNVSAVYLSSNPVQHQHTKHIEIDIHFVHDLVDAGQV